MKSIFIGTVDFSLSCLKHLISMDMPPIGVVTRPSSTFNADYTDLVPTASAAGIAFLQTTNINEDASIEWIKNYSPDVILCWGWSQILSPRILNSARLGVVGYHPTLLPRNRGRHPIIWALALGLRETGSTFFFMDESADSGDILSQTRIDIAPDDNARSLYSKLTDAALAQITNFMPQLVTGNYERKAQPDEDASSWRKRSVADGRIDWRMSADAIYNLVRALSHPYPGATVLRAEADQVIWHAEKCSTIAAIDFEPGRVVAKADRIIDVKTGDGVIRLIDHELTPIPEIGEYL